MPVLCSSPNTNIYTLDCQVRVQASGGNNLMPEGKGYWLQAVDLYCSIIIYIKKGFPDEL
jgi:hypothetical protein